MHLVFISVMTLTWWCNSFSYIYRWCRLLILLRLKVSTRCFNCYWIVIFYYLVVQFSSVRFGLCIALTHNYALTRKLQATNSLEIPADKTEKTQSLVGFLHLINRQTNCLLTTDYFVQLASVCVITMFTSVTIKPLRKTTTASCHTGQRSIQQNVYKPALAFRPNIPPSTRLTGS